MDPSRVIENPNFNTVAIDITGKKRRIVGVIPCLNIADDALLVSCGYDRVGRRQQFENRIEKEDGLHLHCLYQSVCHYLRAEQKP